MSAWPMEGDVRGHSPTSPVATTSVPTQDESTNFSYDTAAYYIFLSVYALASLIICSANTVVLTVLCKSRKLKNKTNFLVGNMACGDLGMGLIMPCCFMPYYIIYAPSNGLSNQKEFCLSCCGLNVVFLTSSVSSLLCVNAERYTKIVHPFKYDAVITKVMVVSMVVTSWCTGWGFMVLLWVGNTWEPNTQGICTLAYTSPPHLLYCGAVYSVMVLLVFAYFSGRVIHTARKQRQMIQAVEVFVSAKAAARRKKEHHLAKMFVLIGVFYVLLVPYICLVIFGSLFGGDSSSQAVVALELVACLLAYLSACVCPIMYIYKDVVFRNEVRRVFGKVKKRLSREHRQAERTVINEC